MVVIQALCLRGEQLELATEARMLRAMTREMVVKGEAVVKLRYYRPGGIQMFYMFDTPEEAAAGA